MEHNLYLIFGVILYTFPAAPNPEIHNTEERNKDVPEIMDAGGEEFEFADTDFEEGMKSLSLLNHSCELCISF